MTRNDTALAPSRVDSSARLHHLDALRAGALLLGVLLHALMAFAGVGWLVDDSQSSELPPLAIYVIHLFRMVLFMLLAGYFGRMVLFRRGVRGYLRDRGLRIGLALVVFWPIIAAGTVLAVVLNATFREVDSSLLTPDPAAASGGATILALPPLHLWFLLLLLESVLVVVMCRWILRRLAGPERAASWSRAAGRVLSSPAGVLIAAVPYAAGVLLQGLQHGPEATHGIREPTTLVPVVGASIAYLGAFLAGWFLHAAPGSIERIARQWIPQLATAVPLSVVGYLGPEMLPMPLAATATALAGWAWTFALIGVAARVFRRESPVVRYLADSSYWIYLLHFPILLLIAVPLADLAWPWPVKLVITLAVAMGVLLLSYDLLVRSTWIGRWLNGGRRPRALSRKGTLRAANRTRSRPNLGSSGADHPTGDSRAG